MPIYTFIHPETEETIEVVQKMKELHAYVDEHGVEWRRKWTLPNAAIDADVSPWDENSFKESTKKKKGSYADALEASKEMSLKRAEKNGGVDPVKQKYLKEYSEKRKGKAPPLWMTD